MHTYTTSRYERSSDFAELAGALARAQARIKPAHKDRENTHLQSRYSTLAALWDSAREALTAEGLAVLQTPFTEGERFGCETILAHASGQWISCRLEMLPAFSPKAVRQALGLLSDVLDRGQDPSEDLRRGLRELQKLGNGPQAIGSMLTYARRLSLAALVGLAPGDDDDDAERAGGEDVKPEPTPARYIEGADLDFLKARLAELEVDVDGFLKYFKAESLDAIPLASSAAIAQMLGRRARKRDAAAKEPKE
jgi:hypothetical protein